MVTPEPAPPTSSSLRNPRLTGSPGAAHLPQFYPKVWVAGCLGKGSTDFPFSMKTSRLCTSGVPWMEGQVTRMSLDSSQDPQLPPLLTSQGVSMDLGVQVRLRAT